VYSVVVLCVGDYLLCSGSMCRRLPLLCWFYVQEITFSVVVLCSGDNLFCSGSMLRRLPIL